MKPIQINSENFPNINIYLEDFTESESISIVEEKNGFFKESDSPKIFREKGTRSVRFVLFVQYPLQKKRNEAA
ncbi:MAG: hypothetical protein K8R21_04010, partial [Leptospira sp.]|nr:hypothetical protein [Leptospira sp.]